MSANVEIKARVRDPEAFAAAAAALSDGPVQEIPQHDVFFRVPAGRLKLRRFADGTGELIQYSRPDRPGPKTSDYVLAPTTACDALREALARALGEAGEVIKRRRLWLSGRTRIHLDDVEGLGCFMELEVVLEPQEDPAAGRAEADRLMADLGVVETDLVDRAYVDLLNGGNR
ncbi:class IV adenylate cyclase [bacterium]|nr:class IV adenylate cyclase [bacterium]HPF35678.1 class IV adenylate cyclase [Candidatus Krumholzibacteria bacterium]HRX51362.1 class IV adenylate cyclase [Candidatus Krumholzibacteria bacterium]